MRTRILIVLVGVASLATLVLIVKARNTRAAATAAVAANVTTDDELKLKVASLERQVASLRDLSGRAIPTGGTANAEPADPPKSKQRSPLASMDPVARQQAASALSAAQRELLRTRFEQESRDGSWSDQASGKLVDVYKGEPFKGIDVARADCRSTMCRVDLRIDSPASGQAAVRLLGLKAPWSARSFISVNTETGRGTFYLARAGHELPVATLGQ